MMQTPDHRMKELQHTLSDIPDYLVQHHNVNAQNNVIFEYNEITSFHLDEILRIDQHYLKKNLFVEAKMIINLSLFLNQHRIPDD